MKHKTKQQTARNNIQYINKTLPAALNIHTKFCLFDCSLCMYVWCLLLFNQVSNAEIRIFDSPNNWYTYRLEKHFWYTIYTNKQKRKTL